MDLFVINRYREDNENEDLQNQETKHLENLKKQIEERKKSNTQKKLKIQKEEKVNLEVSNKKLDLSENLKKESCLNSEELVVTEPEEIKLTLPKYEKNQQEFKVLGGKDFEPKPKVQRILPYWLSHPFSVSKDLQSLTFSIEQQTWLKDPIKSTLKNEGITHLFPVQAEVIPFILKQHELSQTLWPHDVCVSAPTGSGKTLSFVIPIIQILMKQVGHHIKALVVLPVQELAAQIAKVFKKYCSKTGLRVALLSGSTPLQLEQQQIVRYTESYGWISEVDIIVCTAGRLVEHIQNTEGFSLKHMKFLVIDEADRIMDHIQNDWLYHLDRHTKLENKLMSGKVPSLSYNNIKRQNAPPQKLLFSATLSQDPEKLEQWGLFQPKLFSAAPVNDFEDDSSIRKYTTPDELKEQFITCNAENKPLVLYHLLIEQKWDKVLVFTNAAQSAHRLTVLFNTWGKDKVKVAELSAALNRTTRDIVLKKFTQSEINVLIGTDALARGIDIPDCNYVISYDPPRHIKTYIHRVGRTGRAGRLGHAITILLPNQISLFKELIQTSGKEELPQMSIELEVYNRLSEAYQVAINETKTVIQAEISTKVNKSIDLKRGFKAQKRKLK